MSQFPPFPPTKAKASPTAGTRPGGEGRVGKSTPHTLLEGASRGRVKDRAQAPWRPAPGPPARARAAAALDRLLDSTTHSTARKLFIEVRRGRRRSRRPRGGQTRPKAASAAALRARTRPRRAPAHGLANPIPELRHGSRIDTLARLNRIVYRICNDMKYTNTIRLNYESTRGSNTKWRE